MYAGAFDLPDNNPPPGGGAPPAGMEGSDPPSPRDEAYVAGMGRFGTESPRELCAKAERLSKQLSQMKRAAPHVSTQPLELQLQALTHYIGLVEARKGIAPAPALSAPAAPPGPPPAGAGAAAAGGTRGPGPATSTSLPAQQAPLQHQQQQQKAPVPQQASAVHEQQEAAQPPQRRQQQQPEVRR